MISNFLFHRVNPKRDRLWDPMDVPLYERCIKYISKSYKVVLIEDLLKSGELFGQNNYATIMHDDGYKDNIQFAAPILEKYNCKASFYVVTDCVEKNIPTWTHILEHTFQFTNVAAIDLTFDFLPVELRTTNLPTTEERIRYISKLKPYLKKVSNENRNLVLDRVVETYIDTKIPELMMNWNDLVELKKAGHYIGSHTITHSMLGNMSNENDIRNELLTSAKIIEEKLGHFPVTISYPIGSYNETVKRISKEVGYKIGLAVKQNTHDPSKEDVFDISRIELYNEPWFKTRLRITNTLEKIKIAIKYR